MMTVVTCCTPKPTGIRLPKRLARVRRVIESKRLDSFKQFHEALRKTAKEEQEFLKDFFRKSDLWDEKDEDEETDVKEKDDEE